MSQNLPSVLCKKLAVLDNDAVSRKSAMKAFESYVKEMDSKSIPLILSQLLEVKETGSLSEENKISLYEVLARAHGVDIVPHLDSIMDSIVRSLASNGGHFPLQQSCSKVIPAFARYCIDPIMPEDRKRHVIHSLCDPLCQSLLGSQESLSAGAAICLKALVDSDNWQFASDAMVNKVSLNVAVALEVKSNQTNPHMGLVMALAEKNPLIVEAYARLLIGSGLIILNAGAKECNSQKRLSAIQMVNFLMKSLDPRSVYSELDLIIEEMEKYESDQMAFVKGAAFEALLTARRIIAEKKRKYEKDSTPKSNSSTTHGRNFLGFGNQSPESHTLDSFSKSDTVLDLLKPLAQVYSDMDSDNRIVKQRVQRFENGVVNMSIKDGLFSELSCGNDGYTKSKHSRSQEMDDNGANSSLEFVQESPSDGADSESLPPGPQRSPSSKFYIGNTHMSTTSRKHVHSLQYTISSNSGSSMEKQNALFMSSPSSKSDQSQTGSNDFNVFLPDPDREQNGNMNLGIEQIQGGSESVLLTDAAAEAVHGLMHRPVVFKERETNQRLQMKTWRSYATICGILFILLALINSLLWIDNNQEFGHVVPT